MLVRRGQIGRNPMYDVSGFGPRTILLRSVFTRVSAVRRDGMLGLSVDPRVLGLRAIVLR
jgi:hypothetical protein